MDQFGRNQLTQILLDVRDEKISLLKAREEIDRIYYLYRNAHTHLIVRG